MNRILISGIMASFLLSSAALADGQTDGKATQEAGVGFGVSSGTHGTNGSLSFGGTIRDKQNTETLERDWGSVTKAIFQPELHGNFQLNAVDGSIEKGGVAVKGFQILRAENSVGSHVGIMQGGSPTLQYKMDKRTGLTELPRLDILRVGATSFPTNEGNICGLMGPLWFVGPNGVSAVSVNSTVRVAASWNLDVFCHTNLGKTGQLDVQAGAELMGIAGEKGGLATRVHAGSSLKKVGGTPVYVGAEISRVGLDMSGENFKSATDAIVYVGIAQ